jgi:hypothetical protein
LRHSVFFSRKRQKTRRVYAGAIYERARAAQINRAAAFITLYDAEQEVVYVFV